MSGGVDDYSVGADRVVREGDELVITSAADMPDWTAREFMRPRVHHDGREYAIVERTRAGKGYRYRLAPWTNADEEATKELFYDEDAVRERDREARAALAGDFLRPFVPVVYVLAGFLPSAVKARLEARSGVDSRLATRVSGWAEVAVVFILMVFLCIALLTGGFLGGMFLLRPGPLALAIVILAPDAIIRLDSSYREEKDPLGFYEWALRKWLGGKPRRS